MRTNRNGGWPALGAACFAGTLATAAAAPVPIEVRDSATGAFVDAEIAFDDLRGRARTVDIRATDAVIDLAGGHWHARIGAPGYRAVDTVLTIMPGDPVAIQVWLDPLNALAPRTVANGQVLVSGRIHDRDRRAPAAGIVVRLADASARTDDQGYFAIALDGHAIEAEAGRLQTLRVESPGRAPLTRSLRLTPGSHHLILDLGGDLTGVIADHRFDQRDLQWLQADIEPPARVPAAPILAPPTSIRVGFADAGFATPCCVGACSAVAVMSLETYVQRGLNDEWIASWNGHGLRAGAVAYRSYGAWHVANPRTASYDICSSACCQVNDPDTSASTNAAVAATAGIMLERNAAIFRAEYSAENNAWDDPDDGLACSNVDLSCGDGQVGSPSANWTCLADVVASGHGCFGHGRGMSQWGSQRWAQNEGQRWPWIVNHYYNAHGSGGGLRTSIVSSPLRIDAVAAMPGNTAAGATLSIDFAMTNLAGTAHSEVFLGASLYRSSVGYVSDPANDLAVALATGASAASRPFVVPQGLPDGAYDLIVALYLDIDGNAAINSGDLALTTATVAGAVTIATIDGVFDDGFESVAP